MEIIINTVSTIIIVIYLFIMFLKKLDIKIQLDTSWLYAKNQIMLSSKENKNQIMLTSKENQTASTKIILSKNKNRVMTSENHASFRSEYMFEESKFDKLYKNNRASIINWLVQVHAELELSQEVLFMTVSILDRIHEQIESNNQGQMYLHALACLFIASKYHDDDFPHISDFLYVAKNKFSHEELIQTERLILSILRFGISSLLTSNVFLDNFLTLLPNNSVAQKLSYFITERMLQENHMLRYRPSMISASAIFITNKEMGYEKWSNALQVYTTYHEKDLTNCVQDIMNILRYRNTLNSVNLKYATRKHHYVPHLIH